MFGASLLHRGLDAGDMTALIEAHDWLNGLANRDCDCQWNPDESKLGNPCDVCQARHALDSLAQVIDPKPISLHPNRLKSYAERIYYELWCKENERKAWLNNGYTLIEHLLCPEGQKRPEVVSQHDMTIATTVIQWLGTNCGRCFIENAEREIEKRRAERSAFVTDGCGQSCPEAWAMRIAEGEEYAVADSIAATFVGGKPDLASVRSALRQAIVNAIAKFSTPFKPGTTLHKQIQPRPWYPPLGAHEVLYTHNFRDEHEVTARYWLSPDREDLLRVELVSVDLLKPGPEHAGILEALSDQWGDCPFKAVKEASLGY